MNLRLYRQLIQLEAAKVTSYRGDFWITAVTNIIAIMAVNWFLWKSIYEGSGTTEIRGFTLSQMMTYLIGVNLIGRVVRGADLHDVRPRDPHGPTVARSGVEVPDPRLRPLVEPPLLRGLVERVDLRLQS